MYERGMDTGWYVEVGWAFYYIRPKAQAQRSGLGLSPKVGLGPKPNFFTYIVKPEPDISLTYLVNFSSPKKPEPKV
jgi:hypothetical protein